MTEHIKKIFASSVSSEVYKHNLFVFAAGKHA